MNEMPVNDGREKVTAFPVDLQMFADEAGNEGNSGGDVGGSNIGTSTSTADVSGIDTTESDSLGSVNDSDVVEQSSDDGEIPSAVKQQSDEANAAFARMRKEKEAAERKAQQIRDEVQRQRDAEYAKRFGQSHGIFTEAQYWAAMDRERQAKEAAQKQQQSQLPQQIYQQAIKEGYDPKVAELMAKDVARDIELQNLKQQLIVGQQEKQMEKQQAQRDAIAKQIIADHEALSKKYGEMVPALEDLDEATVNLMRQGVPLKAAWLTTHEDEIIEFAKSGGARKALKNVNSKAHLQSERSGAGDFGAKVELSPEQLRVWRAMGYSEAEARRRAAKYAKQGK